jgi:hypothetical protein
LRLEFLIENVSSDHSTLAGRCIVGGYLQVFIASKLSECGWRCPGKWK